MATMAKRKLIPPPPPPPQTHRRDYAQGLSLDQDTAEFLNRIMADDPREIIEQVEFEVQAFANEQFEQLRVEIEAQEKERKSLWGNKFPYKLGQKPGEDPPVEPPARRYRRGRVPK